MPVNYLYFLLFIFLGCQGGSTPLSKTQLSLVIQNLQDKSQLVAGDSSLLYLLEAADKLNNEETELDSLKAENFYLKGLYFDHQGNLDSAASNYHTACRLVGDSINSDHQRDYFNAAFQAYFGLSQYGDCLSISELFLSKINPETDYKLLSYYYYFNQYAYSQLKKNAEAKENNDLRIKMLQLARDTVNLPAAIISKARITFHYLKDPKSTFELLDGLVAKESALTTDFKRQLFGTYGIYLFYEGEYKKAIEYYRRSLSFSKQLTKSSLQREFLATSYANIAEGFLMLKDYKNVEANLDSLRQLGINKISNSLQESFFKYQMQLTVETDKDISQVFDDLNNMLEFRNEDYLKKTEGELAALTLANEKEKILLAQKQSSEIKYIKLQNRLLIFLFLASLLLLLGIFYYQRRKHKFEKQNLQLHQRLLRSQMNPHFTFNTLYAIQRLIKKDQEAAITYLFTFSRLLRLILENSTQDYVQINKELESLNKFLALQLFRFPDKFKYEIVLNNFEADDLIFIPPMILQPIVENCIDHGFSGIDYQGEIKIKLSLENKYILCSVEDNGRGIRISENPDRHSTSTRLISKFLSKSTGSKIEITDKKMINPDQSGVLVKFHIPYNNSAHD